MFITDPAEDVNADKKGGSIPTQIAPSLFTPAPGNFDWNAENFLRQIGSRWCFCSCEGGPTGKDGCPVLPYTHVHICEKQGNTGNTLYIHYMPLCFIKNNFNN